MTQDRALSILTTGANVFLTGAPGSGKTHVLRQYIEWLRLHEIEPAVTASTGVAATHIHGVTIHAWSGIGISAQLSPYELDRIMSKEPVVKKIQNTQVLVIDEISMLSGTILDAVDLICKGVRASELPFGGMQVVLVGDFFQLPPVAPKGTRVPFAFESSIWQTLNPIICYLSEQHRQEDSSFLRLLNSIRAGSFAEDEGELLQDRYAKADSLSDKIPRLYTHNADVDRINNAQLEALAGNTHTFEMESSGKESLVESLKRGCLSPEHLVLKENSVVMCTKNNAAFGYANGTLGRVVGFDTDTGYPVIETIDERTLTLAPVEWVVEEEGKIRAKIIQIPLRLAWAITVHKSQGMSMDAAAMDLSRAFEYGQGYVALSRVRTLEGLYLLGWSLQALAVHPLVDRLDRELQGASEAAIDLFTVLDESGERLSMEHAFIKASGGTIKVQKENPSNALDVTTGKRNKKSGRIGSKRNTYEETLQLIQEGKSIQEIASVRELAFGTICEHLEKLAASDRLDRTKIDSLLPSALRSNISNIEAAFNTYGLERLTPVFSHFEGLYSYDDLKLARAYMHSVLS